MILQKIEIFYDDTLIRNINFEKNLNLIVGFGRDSNLQTDSSNSLGKTLLLKFIDYLYGSNSWGLKIQDENMNRIYITGFFKQENSIIKISRKFKTAKLEVLENGITKFYKLDEFKKVFNIDRPTHRKTFLFDKRKHIIADDINPKEEDYNSAYKLFNLDELKQPTNEIIKRKEQIKELKTAIKIIVDSFDSKNTDFLIKQDIEKLESDLKKLRSLNEKEINEIFAKTSIEYSEMESEKNELFNRNTILAISVSELTKQYETMHEKDDTKKVDMILKYAKSELGAFIQNRIDEVDEFHKKVFEERSVLIKKEINSLNEKILNNEKRIVFLTKRIPFVKKIVEENSGVLKAFKSLEQKQLELDSLNKQLGLSFDFQKLENQKIKLEKEFDDLWIKTQLLIQENDFINNLEKYQHYSLDMVRKLYGIEWTGHFNITNKKKTSDSKFPFNFEFKVKSQDGEGIGNAKNLIIDLMFLKFNNNVKQFIWDSACFNGVDPKQITTFLNELKIILKETNKKAVIAINNFQLQPNIIEDFKDDITFKLLQNDKLLPFDFD